MPDTPVLVAGAGPVGLTAALLLARFGTPVRIIDQNESPTQLSKALVLWRRSLLALDPFVPAETFATRGLLIRGARFLDAGAFLTQLPLEGSAHALPPGVLIPQSEVERTLVEALQALGVRVERRTALRGFTAAADGVTAALEGPRGPEQVRTPWLLGCDGAHSTVRHTLGAEFPGESLPRRWLLADVEAEVRSGVNPHASTRDEERTVEPGWVYISGSGDGAVAIFPIGEGRHRVIIDGGPVPVDAPRRDPTLEDVQAAIHARTRLQWRLLRSHWLADFRVNERQVPQYVHGRVLLAGDAAHVHSPAGGQGMNTGIQDAANMAWKVALACQGCGGAPLMQSYHDERHPVAAGVLRMSGRMLRAGMLTNPVARQLRGMAMSLALSVPAVRRHVADALTEDDVRYLDGPLAGAAEGSHGAVPGHAFPDSAIGPAGAVRPATDLLRWSRDDAADSMGTLLLMPGADRAAWPSRFGSRPLRMRTLPRAGADGTAGADGAGGADGLHAALRLRDTEGVLVRPDGIIAAAGAPHAIGAWLESRLPASARG